MSVLDWGGGLGYYYFVAPPCSPTTVGLDYHCKDMPVICDYGRRGASQISFWDNDKCLSRRYDLVFASSSLQYGEPWESTL